MTDALLQTGKKSNQQGDRVKARLFSEMAANGDSPEQEWSVSESEQIELKID